MSITTIEKDDLSRSLKNFNPSAGVNKCETNDEWQARLNMQRENYEGEIEVIPCGTSANCTFPFKVK